MTVDRTEENRLKITLSAIEIYDYFGSFKDIRYDNPRARSALGDLLLRATDSRRFLRGRRRLYIKVFPTKGGGCVIYFTAEGRADCENAVMHFSSCDALLSACGQMAKENSNVAVGLYESDGCYRLILPRRAASNCGEWSDGCYISDFECEKTKEHWHKICDNTPLYKICGKGL